MLKSVCKDGRSAIKLLQANGIDVFIENYVALKYQYDPYHHKDCSEKNDIGTTEIAFKFRKGHYRGRTTF